MSCYPYETLWEEQTMNTTLIALQARMIQSSIAFWQATLVAQKHWYEAMIRLPAVQNTETAAQPTGQDAEKAGAEGAAGKSSAA